MSEFVGDGKIISANTGDRREENGELSFAPDFERAAVELIRVRVAENLDIAPESLGKLPNGFLLSVEIMFFCHVMRELLDLI